MLFHVTTQHSWETCRGRMREGLDPHSQPPSEMYRWVEGSMETKWAEPIHSRVKLIYIQMRCQHCRCWHRNTTHFDIGTQCILL